MATTSGSFQVRPTGPRIPRFTPGQTFILCGSLVLGTFGGLWYSLKAHNERKVKSGANPHYEQLIAHVSASPYKNDPQPQPGLSRDRYEQRVMALDPIRKEHEAHHRSIAAYKSSPDYVDGGHREAPSPQRAKGDGSGLVYTKAPTYAESYRKVANYPKGGDVTKL